MVYSYSGKTDRKYPYYVCLHAQRKGWVACPSKSLPALAIEESVLGRIREFRPGCFEPTAWALMDRHLQVESIRNIIERIGYDGVTHQVSIRFQTAAIRAAEREGA
jgi:hypothetical protein